MIYRTSSHDFHIFHNFYSALLPLTTEVFKNIYERWQVEDEEAEKFKTHKSQY